MVKLPAPPCDKVLAIPTTFVSTLPALPTHKPRRRRSPFNLPHYIYIKFLPPYFPFPSRHAHHGRRHLTRRHLLILPSSFSTPPLPPTVLLSIAPSLFRRSAQHPTPFSPRGLTPFNCLRGRFVFFLCQLALLLSHKVLLACVIVFVFEPPTLVRVRISS